MSAIRDRILRGEAAVGTPDEAVDWICESIATWTEAEKAQARAELRLQLMRCSPRIN